MIKIKAINIHALRGIPDLELELDGKNLLLLGENGTGKSSIVEAIEFFFTGRISHLEGAKGLSLKRHGPHVNFRPDDVKVEMVFNPGGIFQERTFTSSPSPPKSFENYFQTAQKGAFILRRSQILAFIISQPADRFRAIGGIIGIKSLDDIELEMMRLRDALEGKVTSKKSEVDGLLQDVSTVMGKGVTKIEEVLPALNKMLQKAKLPLLESLEDVSKHAEEMLKTLKKTKDIDRFRVIDEILEATKAPLISEEFTDELNSLDMQIRELLQKHVKSELSVADLLEIGRNVIEEEKMDICPLCQRKIDRKRLLARINKRLKILRNLSEKASEIRTSSVPVIDKLKEIANKLECTISKIEQFPKQLKKKHSS